MARTEDISVFCPLRSFRNLLKSLLNFDDPNPETLSAICEQRPSG